jgi:hypothetical protein
MIQTMKTLT